MAETNQGLTADERTEIDEFHARLAGASRYELLGVDRNADADSIRHAFTVRSRRFDARSFSGQVPPRYQQRLDAIRSALIDAHAVLSDPVRRYLYDQELSSAASAAQTPAGTRRPSSAPVSDVKRTPAPTPIDSKRTPAPTPLEVKRTPEAVTTDVRRPPSMASAQVRPASQHGSVARGPTQHQEPSSSPDFGPPGEARRAGASRPITEEPRVSKAPTPNKQTGPQPVIYGPDGQISSQFRSVTPSYSQRAPAATTPGLAGLSNEGDSATPRVAMLETQLAQVQGEVAVLLAEVERLSVAMQLTIAHALEPEGVRGEQLVSAGQALLSTRVAVASLLAAREETAGRWDAAAALWQRAARARPGEVMLLVKASDAFRKGGRDIDSAEALARQAIALDPDCAEAHTALALVETRRR
jgi:hypothetical protein